MGGSDGLAVAARRVAQCYAAALRRWYIRKKQGPPTRRPRRVRTCVAPDMPMPCIQSTCRPSIHRPRTQSNRSASGRAHPSQTHRRGTAAGIGDQGTCPLSDRGAWPMVHRRADEIEKPVNGREGGEVDQLSRGRLGVAVESHFTSLQYMCVCTVSVGLCLCMPATRVVGARPRVLQ